MQVLGSFGLDPVLFAAQLVNFLVIAWVINRFLLRPLMANVKARGEKIAQGLRDAENARRSLEEASAKGEKMLQQASAEAYQLLQNARDQAERLRAAALERAGRDADRLIAEARAVMELERAEMERAVQGLSLRLSGRILESAVEGLFSEEEKARVVARGLERIGRVSRS
ncbi:MAG: F0F1 ATP synthase subunit B [Spirochaetia bacterium]|jgi:F-type H+-transporting ATPase subunit b